MIDVVLLGHEWHGIPDEQVEAAECAWRSRWSAEARASPSRSQAAWSSTGSPGWHEVTGALTRCGSKLNP